MSKWVNENIINWNGESWERRRLGSGDGEIKTKDSVLDILWKCFIRCYTRDIKSVVRSLGEFQAADFGGMVFKYFRLNKIIYESRGLGTKPWDHQCSEDRKRSHEQIPKRRNHRGMRKTRSIMYLRIQVKKVFNSKSSTTPASYL